MAGPHGTGAAGMSRRLTLGGLREPLTVHCLSVAPVGVSPQILCSILTFCSLSDKGALLSGDVSVGFGRNPPSRRSWLLTWNLLHTVCLARREKSSYDGRGENPCNPNLLLSRRGSPIVQVWR